MPLSTSRVPGGTITAADINGIASAVNTNDLLVGARAFRSAALSVPTATVTVIGLDGETFDSGALHDNVTNNSRITIPSTGYYCIVGVVQHPTGTGSVQTRIHKNGSVVALTAQAAPTAGAHIACITVESLTAGDYLELATFQTSGTSKAIGVGSTETWLSAFKMGS